MVAVPDPDKLDDPNDSMHGLYRFKAGFGGTVTEFMREMVRFYRPRTAALWYRLEPLTYRIYKRLMHDVYY
jgi:lipid II:glycine glycyltransferase (peptidoglycan interpeptide bridge formation enzyme)